MKARRENNMVINKKAMATTLVAVFFCMEANAFAYRYGAEYDDGAPTGVILSQRRASSATVKPGRWHADLDKALAYANENGVPLVAIWSNGDNCGHCKKWENNAISEPFQTWMKDSGIVFYFGYYGDAGKGATLGEWCYWCGNGNPGGKTLPLVRLYWRKANGTLKVDRSADGDIVDGNIGLVSLTSADYRPDYPLYVPGDYHTYNMGGRYMTNFLMQAFAGYKPKPVVKYYGGEFGVADNALTGLQAELGVTDELTIPFTRTNTAAQAQAYTNKLVATFPSTDGFVKEKAIVWEKNRAEAELRLKGLLSHVDGVKAGDKILLQLFDATNGVVGVNHVTYVEKVANSPKNPLWIGEKTADTLEFGEWTMDLDVAKEKVRAFNSRRGIEKAYMMVLVGGALWCPDCVMADHWFYDYEANGVNKFIEWAKGKNVALGVVDIPNYTKSGTTSNGSLLTYDLFKMSDGYVSGRNSFPANESERYQSGAQYLSRHGITSEAAAACIERNRNLVSKDTQNGGYRRPEATANVYRTGVPTLLLLRDDGTIAGRFTTFAKLGPKFFSENYLKRLDEMIAQLDEETEESNDNWRTTTESVTKRGTLGPKTLSHVDLTDVYKIDKSAVGQLLNFRLSGDSTNEFSIAIISSANESIPLDSATCPLNEGLSVTYTIPSANCYLVVKRTSEGPTEYDGSSLVEYTVTSDNVLVAGDAVQTETVTDGNPVMTLQVEQGKTYKITNVDEDKIEGVFTKAASDGFYVAVESGSAVVTLKTATKDEGGNDVYVSEYQVWNTGVIGFDRAADSVKEIGEDVVYSVKVRRTGGVSGVAKARISLDSGTAPDDGTIFIWEDEGKVFEWADGEDDTKTASVTIKPNNFADGDKSLVFCLSAVEGESDAGIDAAYDELTLVVKDDDEATAGVIAISGTSPAQAGNMTVVAKAGAAVTLNISREVGSDGNISGYLKTAAGVFQNGKTSFDLAWEGRSNEVKTVSLTMPAYSESTKTFQVSLVSTSDARVDPARKYLTVRLAESDAAFENPEMSVAAVRYVPIAAVGLVVDAATLTGGDVSVEKFAGSLAPGLSWLYDAGLKAIVVSGTPVKAGSWTAVWRVCEDGVPGSTASLTVNVSELAVSDDAEKEPINGAVAVTRTVRDIIVEDSSTSRLKGLLSLTIPPSGRVSAKMRFADGGVTSFIADGWDGLDGTTLVATLVDTSDVEEGESPAEITVRAAADGLVTVQMASGDRCIVPDSAWSAAPKAASWRGYYMVSMPISNACDSAENAVVPFAAGAGYATLRMTTDTAIASGKMAYAGMLPNGKAFSGVGMLMPDPDSWNSDRKDFDRALLPVVVTSEGNVLYGVFSVLANAAELTCRSVEPRSGAFVWSHVGEVDALATTAELDAFGCAYNSESSIEEACSATFADEMSDLKFFALTEELGNPDGFVRGAAAAWNTTATGIRVWRSNGVNKIKLKDATAAKSANGLTFTFNPSTGLVNGSFRVSFVDGSYAMAVYRGVVMPRWGTSCAVCSLNSDLNLRPFISGPAWFGDDWRYLDAKGRERTVNVKRGCSFSVGVTPGE